MSIMPTGQAVGQDWESSVRMHMFARICRVHLSEARMRLLIACGRLVRNTTHACAHTQQVALDDAHKHAQAVFRVLNMFETRTADAVYASYIALLHDVWEEYHDIMASITYMRTTTLFVSQQTTDTPDAHSQAHRQLLYMSELVGVSADLPRIEHVFADMPCDDGMYN